MIKMDDDENDDDDDLVGVCVHPLGRKFALTRVGVGTGRCPYDVTQQLTSCINVTYWQPVIAGDVKTFCR
jgi:hypothetical protein